MFPRRDIPVSPRAVPVPEPEPLCVPVAEGAQLLRCSRAHLYALIQKGQVRTVKFGASRRIPMSELRRLAGETEVAA